jgi:HK97 family phage prohead protease
MSPTPTGRRRNRNRKPRHRSGPAIGPEVRINSSLVELRTPADDTSGDVVEVFGQAIVYNVDYSVRDMFGEFTERMAPGVVEDVIATCDCRYLFNHDGLPLARSISGTLLLEDSDTALNTIARLDLRQGLANDLVVAIERGDVSQMSCGFIVGEDEWNEDYDDRTILRLQDLLDVSSVTYPASPTTSTSLAKRYMTAMPTESRSRIRKAWTVAREMREGKVISAANAKLLTDALEALHRADDSDITDIVERLQNIDQALDQGQGAISTVLEKTNPDVDVADIEPELMPASEPRSFGPAPATRDERREASLSFGDTTSLLYEALGESHADVWIRDAAADWVVFESYTDDGYETYKVDYTLTDGTVQFNGEPVEVVQQTSWIAVSESGDVQENSADEPAEERAADDEVETADEPAADEAEAPAEDEADEAAAADEVVEDEPADEPDEPAAEDETSEDDEERAAAKATEKRKLDLEIEIMQMRRRRRRR